jgi:Acyl-CoA dehydrogenase, C-terminal domain
VILHVVILSEAKDLCTLPVPFKLHRSFAANDAAQDDKPFGLREVPAGKFYRDVKLCTIGEGTSEIQRLVIARQLLKE